MKYIKTFEMQEQLYKIGDIIKLEYKKKQESEKFNL